MSALDALRSGNLDEALAKLFDEVRAAPDDARHRVFLFQLLCVAGQWDRALTQLNVARELDPTTGVMSQAYQEILQCEALRRDVFLGARTPLLFGEPEPWLAQMLEALRVQKEGKHEEANDLRRRALEEAPAVGGQLSVFKPEGPPAGDESDLVATDFEWLADGDTRLGPILEMIVNGRYYWAPMRRIAQITLEPPADLRDVVWTPAQFRWANEGEAVGVIPTRYVGSESSDDEAIRLARKTTWRETGPDAFEGLGQRVLMTDEGEHALMDVRRITLNG